MVSVGAVALKTTTLKAQALVLPVASVAVQVTVLVPRANAEPEAGRQAMPGALSQESVAPGAVQVTIALLLAVQTRMSAGQAPIAGAVVSTTSTERVFSVAGLPLPSLTL